MERAKTIRTNVAELSLDKRGFLRLTLLNTDSAFDLAEAKNQFEAASLLCNNQPYKVLVDTRDAFVTPDKDAENFVTQINLRKAEAIIITSLHYRILAKFYVKRMKDIPVKVFKNEEDAIKWLLSLDI